MGDIAYKRVLLKLSGESLAGPKKYGLDESVLAVLCQELKRIVGFGVQLGIVVGGGNIYRGLEGAGRGMDRVAADHMGMLATVINAIALQNYLERYGVKTRVLSAITINEVAEPYIMRRAVRHLEKGRIVIFAAGTGNPYFTTDTAAALRASEIKAEIILKGTRVDGIYDKDPEKFKNPVFHKQLSYTEVIESTIRVMDLTAITFCQDNDIPIRVFNMTVPGNLARVIRGEDIGSLVSHKSSTSG